MNLKAGLPLQVLLDEWEVKRDDVPALYGRRTPPIGSLCEPLMPPRTRSRLTSFYARGYEPAKSLASRCARGNRRSDYPSLHRGTGGEHHPCACHLLHAVTGQTPHQVCGAHATPDSLVVGVHQKCIRNEEVIP